MCRMIQTDRQAIILQWLCKVHPHAARLFESALWIAANDKIPCRARMISHAYREVCSELMNSYSPIERDKLKLLLDDLGTEFQRLPRRREPSPASTPPVESELGLIAVPQPFLDSAQRVLSVHLAAPKARDRALAVFRGIGQRVGNSTVEVIPIAERWFRMSKYFAGHAHDRTSDDRELFSGDAFQGETEFFEATLQSFAVSAIANLNELDTILEDANT